jgi:crotonobetainyl-CoA:carnitine CoA-transferase CaiB-like acyl-CoA transferase
VSGFFATLNRSRKGVVLDLKSPGGKEVFRRLVAVSDVLIENFAPGTMDRLEWAPVLRTNPGLIYVAISGFGQPEPYVGRGPIGRRTINGPGHERADGPPEDATGTPFIGQAIGDTVPGLWAVIGTGCLGTGGIGVGQFVDVAMYDSLAPCASTRSATTTSWRWRRR